MIRTQSRSATELLLLAAAAMLLIMSWSATAAPTPAAISIVIDDLGYSPTAGRKIIDLDAPIVCAFLPHTPYSDLLMEQARLVNKEIILHLPLQPRGHQHDPGPGAILASMGEVQVRNAVRSSLDSVYFATGLNNHMGSLVSADTKRMQWIMTELRSLGNFFFLDSRTTGASVGYELAHRYGIPATRRDVFLDADRGEANVQRQFEKLLSLARRRGSAVAIGHPYPETIRVLERELALLDSADIQVVSLSELIELQRAIRADSGEFDPAG